VITTHLLPEAPFTALAEGAGGPATIRLLRDAQLSKHLMLLHAIAGAATGSDSGPAAFRAGYELLARIQATDPDAGAWLLGLPHLGGWATDCLIRLEQGGTADFAHFACLVAAAAVRTGMRFELDVPVRDGSVRLPGLGSWRIPDEPSWIRLRCDGERVMAADHLEADWMLLVPDGGSGPAAPQWSGTPLVRTVADGSAWSVLLETSDSYLDRYTLPMSANLPPDDLRRWRYRLQGAWEVLMSHHRWAAEPIAEGISVIVPLTPLRDTDLVSATTPAAFGAISTSWPLDAVTLAETLVHEFQHVKLCGLLDLVPMAESSREKVYAPWRRDPRPAEGLLQGIYAHVGIVRFWAAQRHVETEPDEVLRAHVQFARWRPTIEAAVSTLEKTGSLTTEGERFAGLLRAEGQRLASEPVPDGALRIAREVSLDHWLTWQLQHVAVDAPGAASVADAYRASKPFPGPALPDTWIAEDVRKLGSSVRSRLLNMRYLEPARYRELLDGGAFSLTEPDHLLLSRVTEAAVRGYRDLISQSADPQPEAWVGLALALHQLPASPFADVFVSWLPVLFEVHGCLGTGCDPLDLAAWFG
jgi:HEXXH motif-containing protein